MVDVLTFGISLEKTNTTFERKFGNQRKSWKTNY